jgi:hypothetical protein
MKPLIKRSLAVLAVLGLLASVVAGREKPSEPIAPRIRVPVEELDLSRLERPQDPGAEKNLFTNFAAEAAGPAAPSKPTAPPLPFAYIGKVIEDGKLAVFLSRGSESYSVAAGDTIAGEYRVDAVSDKEVTFTYLPLKTKQRLPL